ncbi:MAG: phosphatase PAP2 family protein [Patescibacteria group bacterium]|nr:phosphatase PAP2 family protein [Patescibacteria group bacterium]
MNYFDHLVFQFFYNIGQNVKIFDWLFVFLAGYVQYFLALALIILFFKEKNWKKRFYFASFLILSALLSRGIITETIRFFYHKARPFAVLGFEPMISHSATYSFPSGHTAFFFAMILSVFFLRKKWGLWFLAVSILMGISRIIVGVHWPVDILGGIAIGLISSFLIKLILPKIEK